MQLVREHFGGHGLAGAALAREQRADAEAAGALSGEAPAVVHREAVPHVSGDLAQCCLLRPGQHQIVPVRRGFDALREVVESVAYRGAAGLP